MYKITFIANATTNGRVFWLNRHVDVPVRRINHNFQQYAVILSIVECRLIYCSNINVDICMKMPISIELLASHQSTRTGPVSSVNM